MTQKFEMADRFNPSAVEQAERNRFFTYGTRIPTNLNGYLNPF